MAASSYSPCDADGPLPVVLMSIPYRKNDYITYGHHDPVLRYIAEHGYEVVVADLIGTGASSGIKQSFFEAREGGEVVKVIEWLANQNWTTGDVGMYGHSYGGQTQLQAAARNPDPLKAIAPVEPAINYYDDALYKGGVQTPRSFQIWFPTLQVLPPSRRDKNGRWKEVWYNRLDHIRESTPFLFEAREHNSFDEYWQSKVNPTEVDVPMLMVAGYRDTHPQCDIECFQDATGPKRLLLGPWRHSLPHEGRESAIDYRRQLVEWFDYSSKVMRTVRLTTTWSSSGPNGTGGGKVDQGAWWGASTWPDTIAEETVSFALTPTGLRDPEEFSEGALESQYEFDHGVGIESTDYLIDAPVNTSADDARSLCFETAPLEHPIEYTGDADLTLRLEATTEEPIIGVRIVDVAARGESRLVTYGFLNPSHRHGLTDTDPLTPGKKYEITVSLEAKSHIFESGHRICVAIGGAHFPITLPPQEHGAFTVQSNPDRPSVLTFPECIHANGTTFDNTIEMNSPDMRIPVMPSYIRESSNDWTASRKHSDEKRIFYSTNSKMIDLPHGPTMTFERETRASTKVTVPQSATLEFTASSRLEFDHETVESSTQGRITNETAQLETKVTMDEYTVFEKFWSK